MPYTTAAGGTVELDAHPLWKESDHFHVRWENKNGSEKYSAEEVSEKLNFEIAGDT